MTGVASVTGALSSDFKVWRYDKDEISLRLDMTSGPLEQILLEAEQNSNPASMARSGFDARVSGFDARVSGFDARVSGFDARTRGRRGD